MSDENATPANAPATEPPEPAPAPPEPETPAALADTHVGTPILALEEQAAAEPEPIAEESTGSQPEDDSEPPIAPESVEPTAATEETTTPLETEVLAEPVKKKRTRKA